MHLNCHNDNVGHKFEILSQWSSFVSGQLNRKMLEHYSASNKVMHSLIPRLLIHTMSNPHFSTMRCVDLRCHMCKLLHR